MKIKKNRACFIICWFGPFPEYFPVWLQTVKYNKNFDFLIFTDNKSINYNFPQNVKVSYLTLSQFKNQAEKYLRKNCSVKRPYRICDYRPMFGKIFANQLSNYDFWGYCDLDLIFGNIETFVNQDVLNAYDAIFNGGHFTLIRNIDKMNNLFKESGAAFNYQTVIKHDAIFAFDEVTGIQQIAKEHKVKARYLIPYVDADVRHEQLVSILDKNNPDNQCFYWENGELYRVKDDGYDMKYQNLTYIHLQKRPIKLKSNIKNLKRAFWITPTGYEEKNYMGKPNLKDVKLKNPFLGKKRMERESRHYNWKKIKEILKRNPYQIYVRLVQAKNGINRNQGSVGENAWKEY